MTITDRQWKALEGIGYEVCEDRGLSGSLPLRWRHSHPLDDDWSSNGMERGACHQSLETARRACWDHAKENSEVLMSRMVVALGHNVVAMSPKVIGYNASLGIELEVEGMGPHVAVFSLWVKVCAGVHN